MTGIVFFGSLFGFVCGMQWLQSTAAGENDTNQRVFGVCSLVCFLAVGATLVTYVFTEVFG